MIHHSRFGWVLFLGSLLTACSSAPKVSSRTVSESEAKIWFQKYCSKGIRDFTGDLVVKSNTAQFKGQFPAGIHVDQKGDFKLEVTNILGGTILLISSHDRAMNIEVPSKPHLNQIGTTHYLGLDVPVLTELLLGDLPCPIESERVGVRVQGNQMILMTTLWKWSFEKSDEVSGGVPIRVLLTPVNEKSASASQIELKVEDWDRHANYAHKVSVTSPEGELKWTWRSRD